MFLKQRNNYRVWPFAVATSSAPQLNWAACGFEALHSAGSWRVRGEAKEQLCQLAPQLLANEMDSVGEVIKRSENRLVLRVPFADGAAAWIVKATHLTRPRRWFRKPALGGHEAISQVMARERGMRVPKILADGELINSRGEKWLIQCSEWVPLRSMRDLFLANPSPEVVNGLLDRATHSLRMLFDAACNHVDFGPHAILMSDQSPSQDMVIDFEYATFKARPCVNTLAAQLGYFGWSIATNRTWAKHEQIVRWSENLISRWGLTFSPACHQAFRENLHARQSLRRRMAR